jgi:hypothetical protein
MPLENQSLLSVVVPGVVNEKVRGLALAKKLDRVPFTWQWDSGTS